MNSKYDIAVLGAGFGGSLFAACAAVMGFSVILIEKHKHPRFAIGESTSPFANLVLEEIASAYGLNELLPLTSYGTWKSSVPQLRCGLKRGFTYFTHPLQTHRTIDRSTELLVAASPCDAMADMHWMREDVDAYFCDVARNRGVDYIDRTRTELLHDDRGWRLTLHAENIVTDVEAAVLVDAGGPRGTLAQFLQMPNQSFQALPDTSAIYSHFKNVLLCDHETSLGAPYPPDWAAVHHLFDGGWIWSLRFDNGIVSAGAALTETFRQKYLFNTHPESEWHDLLALLPDVDKLFKCSNNVQPFIHVPKLSWRARIAAGDDWAMLPSAAASIDPLFSTGIPLTLLGIQRLLELIGAYGLRANFRDYSKITLEEADCTAALVGACYKTMYNMALFAPLTMLYFAGVSYAEATRRTGRERLSNGFMSLDRSQYRSNMLALLNSVDGYIHDPTGVARLEADIADVIAPINVAGLARPEKMNWYGVDLKDLVDAAPKLGYAPPALRQKLRSATWANGCNDERLEAPNE